MRQPLPPLPRLALGAVEGGQHPHVVRRAPGGELEHQRARPRAGAAAVSGDGEHADVLEPDDDRLAAQRGAAVDQLARLLQRLRLVLGERVHPEIELNVAVERHVPGTDAHVQEIAMVRTALPDVLALDQQRPQPSRLRVEAMQRTALELPRLRQLTLALAQVLGVTARLLRRPLADAALLRPAHADREQQHQRQHPARDVQERGVAVDERVPDHAEPADHREQQLDDRGVCRSRLRGRRGNAQFLRRHGRRILARGSMEGQRVRCCHLSPRIPPRRFLHACGVCWLSAGYP